MARRHQTRILENNSSSQALSAGPVASNTFRDVGQVLSGGSVSVVVPRPPSLQVNDIMVAAISGSTPAPASFTPPAGWTLIRTDTIGVVRQSLFWKRAVAADISTATFTWGVVGGPSDVTGVISAYFGVSSTLANPIHQNTGAAIAGSTTTLICPSVTNVVDNTMMICAYTMGADSRTFVPPVTMFERSELTGDPLAAETISSGLSDQRLLTFGNTGARVIDYDPDAIGAPVQVFDVVGATISLELVSDNTFKDSETAVFPVSSTVTVNAPTPALDDVMVAAITYRPPEIQFVSVSSNTAAGAGDITIPPPVGIVDDDILIAQISIRQQQTVTPPAGWTLIRSDGGAPGRQQDVFWKRASGEAGSYLFDITGSTDIVGIIALYRNCTTAGSPIDGDSGAVLTAVSSATAPSINTTGTNRRLVFTAMVRETNRSFTPPAGMIERADVTDPPPAPIVDVTATLADQFVGPAGATGTRTGGFTGGAADGVAQMFALIPNTSTLIDTIPAGWTLIREDIVLAPSANLGQALFWKRATGAEPANYTWDLTSTVECAGAISNYTSIVNVGNPVEADVGVFEVQDNTETSYNIPSLTHASQNVMLVAFYSVETGSVNFIPGGSLTERDTVTSGIINHTLGVADLRRTIAGATGPKPIDHGTVPNDTAAIGQMVALSMSPGATFSFQGISEEALDYSGLRIFVDTDVPSAGGGLKVLWAPEDDIAQFVPLDEFSVPAGGFSKLLPIRARYVRLSYENGPAAQTFFRLQPILIPETDQPDADSVISTLSPSFADPGVPCLISSESSWSNTGFISISAVGGSLIVTSPLPSPTQRIVVSWWDWAATLTANLAGALASNPVIRSVVDPSLVLWQYSFGFISTATAGTEASFETSRHILVGPLGHQLEFVLPVAPLADVDLAANIGGYIVECG